MFTATAVYHDRATLEIRTPFNRPCIDALKAGIPADHRTWNPERKTWTISRPYDGMAIHILRRYFPDAVVDDKPGIPWRDTGAVATGCACDADHRMLHVCQSAPPEVIRAAYRALAKSQHPDTGGDTGAMQRLNDAYARLEAGVRS